jgi:adenylate cyclase
MSQTRRLAAILAADVAGYSRLIGVDEEGTLNRLRSIRSDVIDPKVSEHRGRIVKTTGDGLLVEFSSVVDALRSATEIQNAMVESNAGIAAEKRIEFRVGVHQGDIVAEDGDIFGDGVNVAARLEGLADPRGICVSARVQEDTAGKLDFTFEDMGEQALKNIARPVRVYRVRPITIERTPTASPVEITSTLALPDKPSIAVLPFTNMSGDLEQEYFVDGMVEEITTAISRLPWLFVIARNSSFTYKGKAVDVKQAARELGVRYVLEGSVRKAGNRVRITGQLIDTTTGAHIWAERFDGALDDIFDLQDQVASNVAGAIEPKLRQSEIERASRKPTANLTAYDLYLRALAQSYRYTEEGFAEAVVLARQVLAIDPSYAPAAALVGSCWGRQRLQGWGVLSVADVTEAVRLARQALEAERDDAETIWQAAFTLFHLAGEVAMAAALDRALARNPNLVMFDQHVAQNSMASIVPDLATGWSWNEEGTELTLPLRQGVKWHDGKPFTAKDVKCTWDLLTGRSAEKLRLNPRKTWYSNLEEVTANGDNEVTFRLKRPQPSFLALLASGWSPVYPCQVLPRDMRAHPVGTGPFKFVEFRPNERIRVTRNPEYWKPSRPYLDGIDWPIVPSLATRILGFVAGSFDQVFGVTIPLLQDSQEPGAAGGLRRVPGQPAAHRARQPHVASDSPLEQTGFELPVPLATRTMPIGAAIGQRFPRTRISLRGLPPNFTRS